MGFSAAVVVSAVISAGSAYYQGEEQKKAANADRQRRESEAAAQKAEAERIANLTKPEEQALKDAKFGTSDPNAQTGSTQDFIVPKTSALGGSKSGRSGLGFSV